MTNETGQGLERLSWLPDRDATENGVFIGGQKYYDVYFTGGTISGITIDPVFNTPVPGQYGGTGVANTGKTITIGGSFVTSGTFDLTLTLTNTTILTLPIIGTLTTLAGAETFTNKTLTSPTINMPALAGGTINNCIIGGTTRAAASFTSINANAAISFLATTNDIIMTTTTGDISLSTNSLGGQFNIISADQLNLSGVVCFISATSGGINLSATSGPVQLTTNTGDLTLGGKNALIYSDGASISLTAAGEVQTGAPLKFTAAPSGIVLKRGVNGKTGTFVANGTSQVSISNTSIAITDTIDCSLNTIGGTVGQRPYVDTITAGIGFTTKATAGDTSTYNYAIISNAA